MPAVTDHTVTKVEPDLLGLPVRMGGLGFTDPVATSSSEYEASVKVANPLGLSFFSSKTFSWTIFSIILRVANQQIVDKKN